MDSKWNSLRMISHNLEAFAPELKGHFMCPLCMRRILLDKKNEITQAHIVPRAAGGKLSTYLCKDCNSLLGRFQDKWFGEYLNIQDQLSRNILSPDIKDPFFYIDGEKINGRWEQKADRSLEFIIFKDLNPPDVIERILSRFDQRPSSSKIILSLPFLKNKRMVDLGFLTFGYLLWFYFLGYSWVLQSHLDSVRKQIVNPKGEESTSNFSVFYARTAKAEPWIGVAILEEEIFLSAGVNRGVVFFPPADKPNLFEKLRIKISEQKDIKMIFVKFFLKPFYGPKVGVIYDNRLIIAPDMIRSGLYDLFFRISPASERMEILFPTSKDKIEELKGHPQAVHIKIENSPVISGKKFYSD